MLAIDIETYSSNDLKNCGVYKYVQAPDFSILLFGYSFGTDTVTVIDLANGEPLPAAIREAISDPSVLKTAWNANFERTCIARHFQTVLPASQWECTMTMASQLGLPLSLDTAAKVLKLQQEKDSTGKTLIRYFSIPCKATKTNGERTRNLSHHDSERWQQFKNYCAQDVIVEKTIRAKISFFKPTVTEQKLWWLDQKINDSGVLLDPTFVNNAINMDLTYRNELIIEAVNLTQLKNPNSTAQLKKWIGNETGSEIKTLNKEVIPEILQQTDNDVVKRVLRIRQELAKTSIKKYEAMATAICDDNRVRGLLQYYGANRTGRWAGRLVQVQNLPQNHLPDLDLARQVVREGDVDILNMLFDNVPDTLSQLIRTSFIPKPGHRFIIADFSAIEARVIAWLSGEQWRLDVFNTHGKIYEASAAQMFKVPIETVTKGSDLRQKGKVSELALGYGGGPNALIKMGALKMGLDEEELPKLVAMWRNANKAIVNYWKRVEDTAIGTVEDGIGSSLRHGIELVIEKGIFFIKLPSGRRLSYLRPRISNNRFGNPAFMYEGMDQTTKKWGLQETYGGKLVENIVQAVARDCLAEAMLRLHNAGFNIVMHVHDEVVLEVPEGRGTCDEVNAIMGRPIEWAKGLPLRADSFETTYYKKD